MTVVYVYQNNSSSGQGRPSQTYPPPLQGNF